LKHGKEGGKGGHHAKISTKQKGVGGQERTKKERREVLPCDGRSRERWVYFPGFRRGSLGGKRKTKRTVLKSERRVSATKISVGKRDLREKNRVQRGPRNLRPEPSLKKRKQNKKILKPKDPPRGKGLDGRTSFRNQNENSW